jgi:hypothetical protein
VDAQRYSAQELAELYARRWQMELWFRDLKTSMGMEVLRCQSPAMIHKELEMFFIAYNLIRCLMVQASQQYQVDIYRLSFKGTVDGLRHFSVAMAQARSRKQAKRNCGTNSSKPWPRTWFRNVPADASLGRSNGVPSPALGSPSPATNSKTPNTATVIGKTNPKKQRSNLSAILV